MKTLEKQPTALELAEKRYHDAHDQAEIYPSSDNDEWLFWSRINFNAELMKAQKREMAILKDLNSADQNQGRMPRQTNLSEKVIGAVGFIASVGGLAWLIYWLVTHMVVAQ